MALTKVGPAGIGSTPGTGYVIGNSFLHATGLDATNAKFTGIVTAQTFRVLGNFQVDGTTTTLDTEVTSVDKLEVAANNTTVGVAITQSGSGDILNLYDGSTEVFTVTDGGHIGVGKVPGDTNNFTKALDVNGPSGSAVYVRTAASNTNFGLVGHYGTTFYLRNQANGRTQFDTNGIERMRITNDGKVGIGTNNPTKELHVLGDIYSDGGYFRTKSGVEGGLFDVNGNNGWTVDEHVLRGYANGSERLRITGSGEVLVGTTVSNSAKFKVSDGGGYEFAFFPNDSSINSLVNYNRSGGAYVDCRISQKELQIYTGTSPAERLRIDSSGNIGIGKSTVTAAKVDILGAVRLSRTATYTSHVELGITHAGASDYGSLYFDNSNAAGDYVFRTTSSNTERLRITSDGKVGVHKSSPTRELDVVGQLGVKHGSSGMLFQESNNGAFLWLDGANGDFIGGDYFHIAANNSSQMTFGYAGAEQIFINNTGRLGVAAAPYTGWESSSNSSVLQIKNAVLWDYAGAQFDIGNNYYYDGTDYHREVAGYAARMSFAKSTGNTSFSSGGTGNAGDSFAWTERMRISAGGSVMINTGAGLSDLQVCTPGSSEQDGTFRIGGSIASLGLVLDYDQAAATVSRITANPTYTNNASLLKICVDGDLNPDQLVLKGDGNVGVGEDSPRSLLHLNKATGTTSSYNTGTLLRLNGTNGVNTLAGIGFGYNTSANDNILSSAFIGVQVSSWTAYVKHDLVFATRSVDTNSEPTESMRIKDDGNVVIGGKFNSTWASTVDALTIGYAGCLYEDSYTSGTDNYIVLGNNTYYSAASSGNTYSRNDEACRIMLQGGSLWFQSAPSGTAGNAISFGTKLRVTADGKVGVNINAPTRELDVYSTSSSTIRIHATGTNSYAQVEWLHDNESSTWIWKNGSTVSSYAGNHSWNFYNPHNSAIAFYTATVSRMQIDGAGDVIVASTAAPTSRAKLDVRMRSNHPGFNITHNDGSFYRHLGTVGPYDSSGNGTGSGQYLHVRLRTIWNDESMTMFRITGFYSYSAYAESYVGMYRYNSSPYRTNPYGQFIVNQGNKAALNSIYNEAADPGYLVMVFDWNTNYTGLLIEHIGAGASYASMMQHDLEIIDSKRSTGTAAVVF